MDGAGDADGSSQRTAGEIGGLADGERKGRRPGCLFRPARGSVWGRWIFDSLRLTLPDERGIPASGPFFPLTVAAVIFLIVLLKFTPTEHC